MEQIPKICLNMIIKNESKIITRLLDSVLPFIDHYVLCDTGSTDNTIEVLQEYFKTKNIEGKIVEKPFEDFGKTRSYALKQCENEPNSDYILLLDADMKLEFSPNFDAIQFKRDLTKDVYFILQGTDNFQWNNARIVKNNMGFFYSCPTHEYIDLHKDYSSGNIGKEDIFIRDIGDGGCKDDKFERDIRLLKNGLEKDPENCRYLFYIANSYKDIGDNENAIYYYKKRINSGGWYQEIAMSYYYIGLCYKNLNKMGDAISTWLEGFDFLPKRIEGIYEIIHHYRCNSKYKIANYFYELACKHRDEISKQDELFLKKEIYDILLDYEYTVICYYVTKDYKKVNNIYTKIFNIPNLPQGKRDNMLSNFKFYATNLKNHKCDNLFDLTPIFNIGKNITMNHKYEFHASTPSLCIHNGQLINIVRYVNFHIDRDGHYHAKDENNENISMTTCATRNICAIFDMQDGELKLQKEFEIKYNKHFDKFYIGTEDVRIISMKDSLQFTGNKITYFEGGYDKFTIHIEHGILDLSKEQIESCLLTMEKKNRVEKNWVLFTKNEETYIIYQWHPLKIYKLDKDIDSAFNFEINYENISLVNTIETPAYFNGVRGSTNGVEINDEIWFLCHMVDYENNRYYYHLFIVLDKKTLKIKSASQMFTFDGCKIEYTLGFCYFEKEDTFLLGYSKLDSTPDYYFVSKSIINNMMVYY
tara:strand:+ start:686 stop:2788 length:2103 start_codon:yes stop_codon:yes gene_type:complete